MDMLYGGRNMRFTRFSGWTCLTAMVAVGSLSAAGPDVRLVDAVKEGNVAVVRSLLAQRVDVNVQELDGSTALHWAALRDDVESATLLIRGGADVRAMNEYGVTPLSLACTNGNPVMVATLLSAGADPNTSGPDGETALMTASRTGNVKVIKLLTARGADVNVKEKWRGQTALMWAIAQKHTGAVRALTELGADVLSRSKAGFTPLLFAVRAGEIESVRLLLSRGASPNDTLPGGHSALTVAIENGHYEVAALLVANGANPNADGLGRTPLHEVVRARNPDKGSTPPPTPTGNLDALALTKVLLEHGADVNARIKKDPGGNLPLLSLLGATPFLLAAKAVDPVLMRVLLANGADPSLATESRTTPLMVAAGIGYSQGNSPGSEASALEAVKLCLELGAAITAVDEHGNTAMHGVGLRGANEVATLLLENGASLDVTNEQGWTPLKIAQGVHIWPNWRAQLPTAAFLSQLMARTK
jgi:ankyrin repeat protein